MIFTLILRKHNLLLLVIKTLKKNLSFKQIADIVSLVTN